MESWCSLAAFPPNKPLQQQQNEYGNATAKRELRHNRSNSFGDAGTREEGWNRTRNESAHQHRTQAHKIKSKG